MNSAYRGFLATLTLAICFFITGCGGSSPRFSSHEDSTKEEHHEKKNNGPRFSSKHVEEEKKEDDKKVNTDDVVARFRSRSSTERNTSASGRGSSSVGSDNEAPGKIDDQKMMDVILKYLGTPYQYGGDSKDGIDCSAFTKEVYARSISVSLPRTTDDQMRHGSEISREHLQFGDLIFFNTTGTNPSHVGIYIGDDLFAHASEAFGVTISSLESSYYNKRYTGARRIIE